MAVLSLELLAVLQKVPNSNLKTITEKYKKTIELNANTLDSVDALFANQTAQDRAAIATKASQIIFGDRAVISQASSYNDLQLVNWSATCHLPAACFLRLENTVDVALALKIVTHLQCEFSVRSIGHNPNSGFASAGKSSILLDLRGLNQVNLAESRDIVSVGPGATWDVVYNEIEKAKLTVVGGRAAGVGVGGLIIGGGMSHFSNYWGMVCDNVKNFEVVLADSRIVQANVKENADLFKALKGGGPNFGIVTRFDLYTHPDHQIWYNYRVYSGNDSEKVIKTSMAVQKAMEDDDQIGFFLSIHPGMLVAGMLYRGVCESVPAVFESFDDITPVVIAVPATNGTQYSAAVASSIEGVKRRACGTLSVRIDTELYIEFQTILQDIAKDAAFTLSFTIQPITSTAVEKGLRKGGNCMGIPNESHAFIGILAEWTEDSDDEEAQTMIKQLIQALESAAKARGLLLDFCFMNDASYVQSPLQGYGEENLLFLRKVSLEFDPEGVFQDLQNNGFLLSKIRDQ